MYQTNKIVGLLIPLQPLCRAALRRVTRFRGIGDPNLDRLGRSLAHLIETINNLIAKEIGFKCLQENIDTTTSGGQLIYSSWISKLPSI